MARSKLETRRVHGLDLREGRGRLCVKWMVDGGGRWRKAGRRQLGEIDKSESGSGGGGLSCARCKQGEPKTEDLATLGIEGRRGVL